MSPAETTPSDFELFSWARSHGANVSSVEMVSLSLFSLGVSVVLTQNLNRTQAEFRKTGRGARTVRDIRPGEVFLEIPLALCIYNGTVRKSEMGRILGAVPEPLGGYPLYRSCEDCHCLSRS